MKAVAVLGLHCIEVEEDRARTNPLAAFELDADQDGVTAKDVTVECQ